MLTFDEDSVSDLHKDAFGFRPSEIWWADWGSMNDVGKQEEWDNLLVWLDRENAREAAYQKDMITKFEASVENVITSGAPDRKTAIRWLVKASDCNDDMEYFAWKNGLPYNYFKKI